MRSTGGRLPRPKLPRWSGVEVPRGSASARSRPGGFVLDGGHRFRRGRGSKEGYSPSSASVGVSPPPVLARYNFPDWDVLIVIPRGEGASGERERDLFEEACPIADRDVEKMSRILLVQMLPALLEADLPAFGAALEAYQSYGFKRFEFNTQGPLIPECVEFLRVNGGVGVGMSSWGPSLHAFGRDLSGLRLKAREWLSARGGGEVVLTRANNEGYRLIPAGEAKAGAAASGSSRRETEIARPK